jgi:heavy metal efflux system protein
MELKSIEDWVVEKNFKAVPNIVDVASFGGPTREYQVRVDPDKLISYGLSIGQVEQQLTNNNANAGGSFIEAGLQQINIRKWAWSRNVHDIENTVITDQERHAAAREGYRRRLAGSEDPAGPVRPRDPARGRQDHR